MSEEASPTDHEKQGDMLGSYTLERPLGEGAMGRVWLGRHVKLGRNAAIKVLRPEHSQNSELVGRFFDEARAVNQINHEHIVAISDFVEELEPPRVYCIMEYLPGDSLERMLAKGPLPHFEVLSVMRQVCDALAAAHRLGIVHRDVKPDNIFLTSKVDGSLFAKVLDFGVAKLNPAMKRESVTTTQTGQIIGTPAYMAPEQLVGLDVDPKADVYAVATVLYRLLGGVHPFPYDDVGKLTLAVIKEAPAALPARAPDGSRIDKRLAKVVMQALEKEATDRPTAEELAAVLDEVQRTQAAPPSGRTPLVAALVALVLVGTAAVWFATHASEAPAPKAAPKVEPAKTVKLTVRTEPPGARVTDAATGELFGTTPLAREVPRGKALTVKVLLEGYGEVERAASSESDAVLDVLLVKTPAPPPPNEPVRPAKKQKKMPVTDDGTLDPFGR